MSKNNLFKLIWNDSIKIFMVGLTILFILTLLYFIFDVLDMFTHSMAFIVVGIISIPFGVISIIHSFSLIIQDSKKQLNELKMEMMQNNDDKMDVILDKHVAEHDLGHLYNVRNESENEAEIDAINKKLEEQDKQYEDLQREVKDALIKQKGQKDILALMFDNMEGIQDYFSISKRHAKSSFILAILNCLTGIILLCLAVYFALTDPNNIQPAIIAAIAGGIAELFAATSLVVHKKSLTQLNYYYNALHEKEMFLSTIRLVGNLALEKQDDMYIEIIKNELAVRLATSKT